MGVRLIIITDSEPKKDINMGVNVWLKWVRFMKECDQMYGKSFGNVEI